MGTASTERELRADGGGTRVDAARGFATPHGATVHGARPPFHDEQHRASAAAILAAKSTRSSRSPSGRPGVRPGPAAMPHGCTPHGVRPPFSEDQLRDTAALLSG
jgi:hypothetical protein